jgi:hypothetical protein
MAQTTGGAPAKEAGAENARDVRRARGRLALELVATRGKDVVGVRHVLDGGRVWVGNVADAIARVPSREIGGHPHVVAEVKGDVFAVHLPPRARARLHGADGVPRLLVGPHRIELHDGDRAVLVFGGVQIRAQLVPFASPPSGVRAGEIGVWVAVVALIYAAALVVSSAVTQPSHPPVEPDAARRVAP